MTDFIATSLKYYILRHSNGKANVAALEAAKPKTSSSKPQEPVKAKVVVEDNGSSDDLFARNQKELQELCKRRFFYRQASDIYGGVAGFYTYGPPGSAVKNNIISLWRQTFVISEHLLEIEDSCIMQHCVLKASGHVDRFNDFMVKDVKDESKFFRADKLLEEVMETKLQTPGITEAQRHEYTTVRNQADAYSQKEMWEIFQKYEIKSPETGNDLSEPYEFNLMFPTPIGPGGYLQGYLRPETAQGIFLNYKYCLEQNSNRLPFGVAQVGRSFRNEIAPRAGLTRQREFTQAEIEYFVNPKQKDHPKFALVESTVLILFHADAQLNAQDPVNMTVGEAVRSGLINNETLGYFIVKTWQFLVSIGLKKEYIRFRQHLPTEMAHYACDCWDAEIFGSYGWLECVGIADRSAFDLTAHANAAKCDLQYKESLEKPFEREVLILTKKSGVDIMKAFKKDGKMVKEFIEAQPQEELECIAKKLETGDAEVQVDGRSFTLTKALAVFERKKEKVTVNAFTPGVIEPSFGIDRIFSMLLEHVYSAPPKDEKDQDDKQTRGVLSFAASSAPYKCVILPLDQRIARDKRYLQMLDSFTRELCEQGLSFTSDESNATIGRRYARNDELGVPFAVTFDFETMEDSSVTLRERDTMWQIRLPLSTLGELLRCLCKGSESWQSAFQRFPHKKNSNEEFKKD